MANRYKCDCIYCFTFNWYEFMKGLTKIIHDYIVAVMHNNTSNLMYESCSCGFGSYIGFFASPLFEYDVIEELYEIGFSCKVSYDGVLFRYRFELKF